MGAGRAGYITACLCTPALMPPLTSFTPCIGQLLYEQSQLCQAHFGQCVQLFFHHAASVLARRDLCSGATTNTWASASEALLPIVEQHDLLQLAPARLFDRQQRQHMWRSHYQQQPCGLIRAVSGGWFQLSEVPRCVVRGFVYGGACTAADGRNAACRQTEVVYCFECGIWSGLRRHLAAGLQE